MPARPRSHPPGNPKNHNAPWARAHRVGGGGGNGGQLVYHPCITGCSNPVIRDTPAQRQRSPNACLEAQTPHQHGVCRSSSMCGLKAHTGFEPTGGSPGSRCGSILSRRQEALSGPPVSGVSKGQSLRSVGAQNLRQGRRSARACAWVRRGLSRYAPGGSHIEYTASTLACSAPAASAQPCR